MSKETYTYGDLAASGYVRRIPEQTHHPPPRESNQLLVLARVIPQIPKHPGYNLTKKEEAEFTIANMGTGKRPPFPWLLVSGYYSMLADGEHYG